jgi:serine/threonine protein kinase
MLHVLLTGRRAFSGKTDDNIKDAITNERYNLTHEELETMIPPLARDLLSKLLAMNPEERLSAKQCLEHPWLQANADQLSTAPLPSPDVVRSQFTPAEIRNLSSDNLVEAGE